MSQTLIPLSEIRFPQHSIEGLSVICWNTNNSAVCFACGEGGAHIIVCIWQNFYLPCIQTRYCTICNSTRAIPHITSNFFTCNAIANMDHEAVQYFGNVANAPRYNHNEMCDCDLSNDMPSNISDADDVPCFGLPKWQR